MSNIRQFNVKPLRTETTLVFQTLSPTQFTGKEFILNTFTGESEVISDLTFENLQESIKHGINVSVTTQNVASGTGTLKAQIPHIYGANSNFSQFLSQNATQQGASLTFNLTHSITVIYQNGNQQITKELRRTYINSQVVNYTPPNMETSIDGVLELNFAGFTETER